MNELASIEDALDRLQEVAAMECTCLRMPGKEPCFRCKVEDRVRELLSFMDAY